MSEYLIKKALLEWLKEQQKRQEEKRDRLEIDHPYWEYHEGASDYLSLAVEKIESGAFDADTSEIQRLRAALERIVTVYEECDCTPKDLYLIAVNEVGSKQPKVENEVHEAPEGDGNDA